MAWTTFDYFWKISVCEHVTKIYVGLDWSATFFCLPFSIAQLSCWKTHFSFGVLASPLENIFLFELACWKSHLSFACPPQPIEKKSSLICRAGYRSWARSELMQTSKRGEGDPWSSPAEIYGIKCMFFIIRKNINYTHKRKLQKWKERKKKERKRER